MGLRNTHMDETQLEFFNERAAIYEYLGDKERDEAERLAREDTEKMRHSCEIDSIVRMYREHGGDRVKSYLLQVEKHRGSQAAKRLRNDALEMLKTGENK
jgi:hypothetical protein